MLSPFECAPHADTMERWAGSKSCSAGGWKAQPVLASTYVPNAPDQGTSVSAHVPLLTTGPAAAAVTWTTAPERSVRPHPAPPPTQIERAFVLTPSYTHKWPGAACGSGWQGFYGRLNSEVSLDVPPSEGITLVLLTNLQSAVTWPLRAQLKNLLQRKPTTAIQRVGPVRRSRSCSASASNVFESRRPRCNPRSRCARDR